MNDHDRPERPQPTFLEHPSDPFSVDHPTMTMAAPTETPSKAMAIWSLVLGALPVPPAWLVSVGLGVAVLRRSKDGRNHGKTHVLIGFSLIAAWIGTAVAVIAIVYAITMQMDQDQPAQAEGDVYIEDVRVGDCTAQDLPKEVDLVDLVPCKSSHRLEVYAIFDLPAGPFPGDDRVDQLGSEGCTNRFKDYVGMSYDDSDMDFEYVTPIEEMWADDRSVLCLLDTGGMVTGSQKNTIH
jgi:hypothetical protein